MLPDRMIEDVPVRRTGNRYAVSVRIPWYRSLPLSSVSALDLALDGQQAEPDTLTWTVNGTTYAPDDLPPLWTVWWNVLDSAVLAGAFAGEHLALAHVEVQVGLYIPYLPTGIGSLQIVERTAKRLPIERASQS